MALAVVLTGAVESAAAGAAVPTGDHGTAGRVVVVAVPGLLWSDLRSAVATPLMHLAERGSTANLVVRAGRGGTSCSSGMLTLAAGNRATGSSEAESVCTQQDPEPAAVAAAVAGSVALNAGLQYDADPEALSTALSAAGVSATAQGGGAQLVLGGPGGEAADPRLRVVSDAGLYASSGAQRRTALGLLSARVQALSDSLGPADALLVLGVSDLAGRGAALHPAIAVGPGLDAGLLTGPSTGRPGFVQLIDVGPTVLSLLSVPVPDEMVGQPWTSQSGRAGDFVEAGVAADEEARRSYWVVGLFVWLLVLVAVAVLVAGARRLDRGAPAGRLWPEGVAYAVAAAPLASFVAQLLPWWRFGTPGVGVLTVAFAAAVACLAAAVSRRGGVWAGGLAVSATVAVVLAVDVLAGAPLQLAAVLGDSPLLAGRFHGMGNVDFAVFATGALLAAGLLADLVLVRGGRHARRSAVAAVLAVGAVAVVVDGAPSLGDDFGGTLALTPAVALLALLVGGVRITVRRLAVVALVAVTAGLVVAFADYSRAPAQRTHIGRFVDDLLHGGAGAVVARKATASWASWLHSPFVLLVVVVGWLGLVVVRSSRRPAGVAARAVLADHLGARAGLVAALTCAALGTLLNDSGVAVLGAALAVAAPLVLAATASHALGPGGRVATSRVAAVREDDDVSP